MLANPALRLDLREHDNTSVQEALLSGQVDVILFAAHDTRSGIRTRRLLSLPPYALLPAKHPLTRQTQLTLGALAQHPLIKLNRPLARSYTDALFAAQSITPDIIAEVDTTEMVRSLVGAGLGLAVLNMRPVTTQSYAGDTLAMRPLEPPLPCLELHSGHIPGKPRRLVSTFLDRLHTWMASKTAHVLTVPRPG